MRRVKFISIILVFCLLSALSSCGTVASTKRYFKGEASRSVYSSMDDAIEGFFVEQISGGKENCYVVDYKISYQLTKSEMRNFKLDPYEFIDVKSGYRLIINYFYAGEELSHDFCVLEIDGGYIYYLQEPLDGEAVATNYYGYFVNEEIFKNVTVATSGTITIDEDKSIKVIEVDLFLKLNGDEAEFEFSFRTFFNGGVNDTYLGGYVIKTEDSYVAFGMDGEGKYVNTTPALAQLFKNNDVVRLVNSLADVYLYGHNSFKYVDDKFVLREIEKESLKQTFLQSEISNEGDEITSADYEIEIVGERIYVASANISAGDLSLFVEKKFTDYGKTRVDVPEEIYEYFE